jgi:hypothetical protein
LTSATTTLDLNDVDWPQRLIYQGVDLANYALVLTESFVPQWQANGWLKQNSSVGLTVTRPGFDPTQWDDPYNLIGAITGWGVLRRAYAINGACKLRPTVREWRDSLAINSHRFRNKVPAASSNPGGPWPWGDFPHGGAAIVGEPGDPHAVGVGLSALKAIEDAGVASLIAHQLYRKLRVLDGVEPE